MTVFIVQEIPGRDLSAASEFGDLKILVRAKDQINEDSKEVTEHISKMLWHFDSDVDYLLLSGDPVAIAIACSIASDETNGVYQVLKWDRLKEKYYPVIIDIN